jgi:hypothetical protein
VAVIVPAVDHDAIAAAVAKAMTVAYLTGQQSAPRDTAPAKPEPRKAYWGPVAGYDFTRDQAVFGAHVSYPIGRKLYLYPSVTVGDHRFVGNADVKFQVLPFAYVFGGANFRGGTPARLSSSATSTMGCVVTIEGRVIGNPWHPGEPRTECVGQSTSTASYRSGSSGIGGNAGFGVHPKVGRVVPFAEARWAANGQRAPFAVLGGLNVRF